MKNKSVFVFDDVSSLGINTVPLNSLIQINNVLGLPKLLILIDDTGLINTTTIQDFLNNTNLFTNVGKEVDLTGLLKDDGTTPMAVGYVPQNPLDIVTLEYFDQNAVTGSATDTVKIFNQVITTNTTEFFTTFALDEKSLVFVDGVIQNPNSFTIVGSKITFSSPLILNQYMTVLKGEGYDLYSNLSVTANANDFIITPNFNLREGIMLFLDGTLQDISSYEINGNNLTIKVKLQNTEIKLISTSYSYYYREITSSTTINTNFIITDGNLIIFKEGAFMPDYQWHTDENSPNTIILDININNNTEIVVLKG